jgi:hypothetical protein
LLVILCCVTLGCKSPKATNVYVPRLDEIAEVRASATNNYAPAVFAATPEFQVPPKYIPALLATFTPAIPTQNWRIDEETTVGTVRIRTSDHRAVVIRIGRSGQNPLFFTVDGISCVRGGVYRPVEVWGEGGEGKEGYATEDGILDNILHGIYREEVEHKPVDYLEDEIKTLERSRGTRPPVRH